MSLPQMLYYDGISKRTQVKFGGYNHTLRASEGEFYDMTNMSSDNYPYLAPRKKRYLYQSVTAPSGLYAKDALCWVGGTSFYYGGVSKGTVANSRKTFVSLGIYILIFPDKAYYNTVTDEFGNLESSRSGSVTFRDGTIYGEDAAANTIYASGVDWSDYFKAGDAVTISGCVTLTGNNKTPIIREVDGDELHFYENIFTNGTESAVTIKRVVPDMDFLCENENRLWGCKGDTIYASKLGDPFNWNVFDGISTDSYAVAVGSAGDFTACCSFLGYPIFLKEEHIYKAYGSIPSNFQIMGSATLGVASGSQRSLAIAGETLFYLSRAGIVAYSGGIPSPISSVFDQHFEDAVGGSDGLKYFVSMTDEDDNKHLFVYDTVSGLWSREDDFEALDIGYFDGNVYALDDSGIWIIGTPRSPTGTVETDPVASMVEFGDIYEDEPNKKGVSKLQIRLEVETDSSVGIYIQYDSSGTWTLAKQLTAANKRSYYIPILPRRCDHYRLKIVGSGEYTIYSIGREYYTGSAL